MSKAAVAKRKKKMSLGLSDKTSISTAEKTREHNAHAKAINSNVFETENLLSEDTDEKLEIFYQKRMKKSGLPSLKDLLASSSRDSGIASLVNNSVEEPQQPKVRKYAQNEDIFVSKVSKSTVHNDKQFDEGTSSPSGKNQRKSQDYSISDMFSDGLSQEDNFQRKFNCISGPDNSQTDPLPPAINMDDKKVRNFSLTKRECGKEKKVPNNLGINGPRLHSESPECGSSQLRRSLARSKWQKETLNSSKLITNLSESNKELETLSQKARKSASNVFSSLGQKNLGITSSLVNDNTEPSIVWEEENQTSLPGHRIDKKIEQCSTQDKLDQRITPGEIMADVDLGESESQSINITLSDCNLDHSINSEDCDRSIEMIHKRAIWYMDEASESLGMNHNKDDNLRLTGLNLNFIEHDSVTRCKETDDTWQSGSQLSDPLIELSDTGSQLSGRSNISMTSYVPEFDLSPNFEMSVQEKNPIRQKRRNSGFGFSQSMYIKQRCPFFNRKEHKNDTTNIIKLYDKTPTENEQFRPKIELPIHPKRNYTSEYESQDGNKENERSILDPKDQHASHKNLETVFMNSSEKKSASSNSANRSMKQRYPFDEHSDFFNIEVNKGCDIRDKKKRVPENVGVLKEPLSENQNISVHKFSRSSFASLDISDTNALKRSSHNFWRVSQEVQDFVKEWLDTDDEIGSEISNRSMGRENISLKRRRLNSDSSERERDIGINPEMLLSNYSCEYDNSCVIERFKPNFNKCHF